MFRQRSWLCVVLILSLLLCFPAYAESNHSETVNAERGSEPPTLFETEEEEPKGNHPLLWVILIGAVGLAVILVLWLTFSKPKKRRKKVT